MIRAITPEDCAAVVALIRTAFATIEVPLGPPPSALRVTADTIAEHLDGGGGGGLAGDEGCILWRPEKGGLYVSRLAVHPDRRGRGVAALLLRAAERAAIEAGLARLRLETRLALDANRRLFRRAGFTEREFRSHPGYDVPTYLSMDKHLAAEAA